MSRGVYRCKGCDRLFKRKEIAVDHIRPVVPETGWDNWDGYIDRMFCDKEGFQILCKDKCHKDKTKKENANRRVIKKSKVKTKSS